MLIFFDWLSYFWIDFIKKTSVGIWKELNSGDCGEKAALISGDKKSIRIFSSVIATSMTLKIPRNSKFGNPIWRLLRQIKPYWGAFPFSQTCCNTSVSLFSSSSDSPIQYSNHMIRSPTFRSNYWIPWFLSGLCRFIVTNLRSLFGILKKSINSWLTVGIE